MSGKGFQNWGYKDWGDIEKEMGLGGQRGSGAWGSIPATTDAPSRAQEVGLLIGNQQVLVRGAL